jgi:Ca2+-binding RTX toxin-like protein
MKKAYNFHLGATDDTLYVGFSGAKVNVNGGAGGDSIAILDATSALVHGGTGDDFLQDISGHASLFGDAGNDWLFGTGHDTLTGGAGADHFLVNHDWNHGNLPVDVVLGDFKPSEGDVLDLSPLGNWVPAGDQYVFVPVPVTDLSIHGKDLWVVHQGGGYDVIENVGAIALVGVSAAIASGWLDVDTPAKG